MLCVNFCPLNFLFWSISRSKYNKPAASASSSIFSSSCKTGGHCLQSFSASEIKTGLYKNGYFSKKEKKSWNENVMLLKHTSQEARWNYKKICKKYYMFFRKYDLQKKTTKLSFLDFNFSNIFRLTFSIWSDTAIVFGSVNHSNISSSSNSSPSYLI